MIMYYSLIELPIILNYDKDKNNKRYILKRSITLFINNLNDIVFIRNNYLSNETY